MGYSSAATVHRRPPWRVALGGVLVFVLVVGLVLHQLGVFPGLAAKSRSGPTNVVIGLSYRGTIVSRTSLGHRMGNR